MDIIKQKSKRYSDRRFGGNRDVVLKRDNYTCQVCGNKSNIVVHHKIDTKHNDIKDLITLCRFCHWSIHNYSIRKGYYLRAAEMIDLRNDGWTYKSIASRFNLTRQRVHQIVGEYRDKYLSTD